MIDNPAPWKLGQGYLGCAGYYIEDANGSLVVVDTEGRLTRQTAEFIVRMRNETKLRPMRPGPLPWVFPCDPMDNEVICVRGPASYAEFVFSWCGWKRGFSGNSGPLIDSERHPDVVYIDTDPRDYCLEPTCNGGCTQCSSLVRTVTAP